MMPQNLTKKTTRFELFLTSAVLLTSSLLINAETSNEAFMLIEAESYAEVRTQSNDFARISKVTPSSGNAILSFGTVGEDGVTH